jgi:hypothetical protein
MRGLKILVAVLGVAVLAAFITLVIVILQRGGRVPEGTTAVGSARPPVHASWGRVLLDQPAGTRIQSVTPSGSLIVLQLYTATPGQDERLVVLDPATGAVTGSFAFGQR